MVALQQHGFEATDPSEANFDPPRESRAPGRFIKVRHQFWAGAALFFCAPSTPHGCQSLPHRAPSPGRAAALAHRPLWCWACPRPAHPLTPHALELLRHYNVTHDRDHVSWHQTHPTLRPANTGKPPFLRLTCAPLPKPGLRPVHARRSRPQAHKMAAAQTSACLRGGPYVACLRSSSSADPTRST